MGECVITMLLDLCLIFSFNPCATNADGLGAKPPLPECALQRYDWNEHVVMPPNAKSRSLDHTSPCGAQVNKFGTRDSDYMKNSQSVQFVASFMPNALPVTADTHALLYGALVALANFPAGVAVDLGAGVLKSSNLLGSVFAHGTVFACDTFSGLPEAWERGDVNFPAGTFAPKIAPVGLQPPFPTLDNVIAIRGKFIDTIPQLLPVLKNYQLALVHIDSDTYQSAVDGLEPLLPLLRVGTILVFDEFYNYDDFENGEFRAFMDLIDGNGFKYTPLAFNAHHQQVVIQIVGLPQSEQCTGASRP
ncbi:MAG: class I SAM-dependent methyltransferase [Puniceicoccales bacterium]|jgi:hypothetical protein|nr:class I SAM-dependent methyltransferase [Puniceicoccales bacterium]